MDIKPKTPSPNGEAAKQSVPPPQEAAGDTNSRLQAVLDRARQGDKAVLPELKRILDDNPFLWQERNQLVTVCEQGWLDKIAGKDLLLAQSIRRQVELMKQEIAGAFPTPLESLLAQRIVAAWLALQHADLADAVNDANGGKVDEMRIKRLDSANKRFLASVKSLAIVRRLTDGLKIEINHVERQAADVSRPVSVKRSIPRAPAKDPGGVNADTDAVQERLRDLFKQETSQLHATAR